MGRIQPTIGFSPSRPLSHFSLVFAFWISCAAILVLLFVFNKFSIWMLDWIILIKQRQLIKQGNVCFSPERLSTQRSMINLNKIEKKTKQKTHKWNGFESYSLVVLAVILQQYDCVCVCFMTFIMKRWLIPVLSESSESFKIEISTHLLLNNMEAGDLFQITPPLWRFTERKSSMPRR